MRVRPAYSVRVLAMLSLFCMFGLQAASANEDAPEPIHPDVMTAAFLHAHPDIKFRLLGNLAYSEGDKARAFKLYKRSARFADKASQALVADMLWKGDGVDMDRAAAYAWMDLAAERQYRSFVALREWYWQGLEQSEQERVQEIGQELYATFGDEVAKRRLGAELARGLKTATGSRVGSIGYLRVIVPSATGPRTIDGTEYYAERYWKVDQYLAWQDALWGKVLSPSVEVGEVAPEVAQ